MHEEWSKVEGFNGVYEVSSYGRVRNSETGMILNPSIPKTRSSYPVVYLQKGGAHTKKGCFVHRLVATAFIPNPDARPHVNHIDGCKTNNMVTNLEWVTPVENVRHALRMGLFTPPKQGKGEQCSAAKLTDEKVIEIKRRLASGESAKRIAKDFGVVAGTIAHIKYGKTWTHISV
ncbi:NUMOD4 domain-containing protein [Cupriavidus gilardii]|uniref:NUMOD4 domain-containing protein n=1 Tax=Cupriavidus gilardii TaxID=82541 RepID=UPI0037BEB1C4